MTRVYQQKETRLLSEYLKEYFHKGRIIMRVRLGSAPADAKEKYGIDKANRLFKTSFKWADAVVIEESRVIIIEAKIRAVVTAVSQIKFYMKLWYKTDDFEDYHDLPVELWIVAPWFDEDTREFAELEGIRCVEFIPDWIGQYLEERQHYWASPYRLARQKEDEKIKKILGG